MTNDVSVSCASSHLLESRIIASNTRLSERHKSLSVKVSCLGVASTLMIRCRNETVDLRNLQIEIAQNLFPYRQSCVKASQRLDIVIHKTLSVPELKQCVSKVKCKLSAWIQLEKLGFDVRRFLEIEDCLIVHTR